MGSYHLLVDQSVSSLSYDMHELFTSIGYHLGLAVHKAHLDREAKKQAIFRERLTLAHELHDSLAQSMVSLRFQCKALDDSINNSNIDSASKDVIKLRLGVDKANAELRDLLAHFRAPIDDRGLVPAITDILKKFREENKLMVFSQFDCDDPRPPMHIQRQVIRIVQEALANVKKHADARILRLLLRVSDKDDYYLLIEDDGHGFEGKVEGKAGEHVGLKVMRERAEYINALLNVESEPGEGTRLELSFSLQ
jgi:two-component system nitrate/nitrite sensor histidine kinase NarX